MKRPTFSQLAPIVAAVEVAVLVVIALITLFGSLITQEFEARVLLPELLLYSVFIAGLGLVVKGLWLQRSWAKAPMIAVQLIVIGISYEDFWQSEPVIWKIVAIGLTLIAGLAIAATLKIKSDEK